MRISDWSSDVCSSDLIASYAIRPKGARKRKPLQLFWHDLARPVAFGNIIERLWHMAHPKAASPQLMSWTALLPPAVCSAVRAGRRATMEKITTIGLDIAKSVFQVHGVAAAGEGGVGERKSVV